MADNKPTHRLLLAFDRETKSGNTTTTKTAYAEVCSLWQNEKGSIGGELPKGMTISGRIVIVPADRNTADTPAAMPTDEPAFSET